ncbi:MAG: alpha/beta fold hydrolase [Spirochaetota bacterium]
MVFLVGSGGSTIDGYDDGFVETFLTRPFLSRGIAGHSQGGWIAQMVARRRPETAFVVTFAGPTVSPFEQAVHATEWEYRCDGVEEAAIARKLVRHRRRLDAFVVFGRVFSFGVMGFNARIMNHDPEPDLAELGAPALLLFGEFDPLVPSEPNIAALANRVPDRTTVHVVSGADHRFREVSSQCNPADPEDPRYLTETSQVNERWLDTVLTGHQDAREPRS